MRPWRTLGTQTKDLEGKYGIPTVLPHRSGRRPQEVHASQGLKVGLYTPTILGGYSYLSWFYDRGPIKDRAHTGTSKGLSQAINRGPIRKFLPKYANVYVTIQSHGLSAGARSHYVTANGVRNGLVRARPGWRGGRGDLAPTIYSALWI